MGKIPHWQFLSTWRKIIQGVIANFRLTHDRKSLPEWENMFRPTRILVIDDHPTEIILMREAFRHARWNALVEEVPSGDRLRAELGHFCKESTRPDLVAVDGLHHGESCHETLRTIRATQGLRHASIIVWATHVPPTAITGTRDHAIRRRSVSVLEPRVGHVLRSDICTRDGKHLLPAGHALSAMILEPLANSARVNEVIEPTTVEEPIAQNS
jgi:CheY-like chemotaxis protein